MAKLITTLQLITLVLGAFIQFFVSVEPSPADLLFAAFIGFTLLSGDVLKLPLSIFVLYAAYIGLTLVASAPSFFHTIQTDSALEYVAVELYLASFALCLIAYLRERSVLTAERLLQVYVAGAAVSSMIILSVWMFDVDATWLTRDGSEFRLKGFFKDPNVLAPFLVFPIIYLISSVRSWGGVGAIWTLVSAIAMSVLLLITYSRGGLVCIAVALLTFLGVFMLKTRFIKHSKRFLIGVSTVGIALLFFLYFSDIHSQYLNDRLELKDYDDDRFFHIVNGFKLGGATLFGLGPDVYAELFGINPHHLFVGKLTDAGWGPAIILCGFVIAATYRSLSTYLITEDRLLLALGATLAGHIALSQVIYSHHWRHLIFLCAVSLAITGSRRLQSAAIERYVRPPRAAPI